MKVIEVICKINCFDSFIMMIVLNNLFSCYIIVCLCFLIKYILIEK